MIKNITLTIFKDLEEFEAEKFSPEFAGIMYYFTYNLKKIKIEKCFYIDIRIVNEKNKTVETRFSLVDKTLFVTKSIDLSFYSGLDSKEKIKFQYKLVSEILDLLFDKYNVDLNHLKKIEKKLAEEGEMKIQWPLSKKEPFAKIKLIINIDSFDFYVEIIENGQSQSIHVFKSIPLFLAVIFFSRYKVQDNLIKIGTPDDAFFEVDILKKRSKQLKSNKAINSLKL